MDHLPRALVMPQAGGADRALLVMLADERRTLDLVVDTVRQMQGAVAGGATTGAAAQGGQHG